MYYKEVNMDLYTTKTELLCFMNTKTQFVNLCWTAPHTETWTWCSDDFELYLWPCAQLKMNSGVTVTSCKKAFSSFDLLTLSRGQLIIRGSTQRRFSPLDFIEKNELLEWKCVDVKCRQVCWDSDLIKLALTLTNYRFKRPQTVCIKGTVQFFWSWSAGSLLLRIKDHQLLQTGPTVPHNSANFKKVWSRYWREGESESYHCFTLASKSLFVWFCATLARFSSCSTLMSCS